MPNVVQLYYLDGTKADWLDVDRAICHRFEAVADDEHWYGNWYNVIGLYLALGKTMPQVVDLCKDTGLRHVACFMATNYTADAWYEHKR